MVEPSVSAPCRRSYAIDVVVPHVEGRERLLRCLAALRRQSEGHQLRLNIFVVHDQRIGRSALDEGAREECNKELAADAVTLSTANFSVRVIKPGVLAPDIPDRDSTPPSLLRGRAAGTLFGTQLGFAAAVNLGVDHCHSELVLLLNDDCFVDPGCLETLIAFLDSNPLCAAVQPKLLSNDRQRFDPGGGAGGYLDRHGVPFVRGRMFGSVERDRGQYDGAALCTWVCGACMLVRRELWHATGGFPSHFGAHMEEVDLCWRLRKVGYWVACEPAAVAVHQGAATLAATRPLKLYLNHRNNLLMLRRQLVSRRRRTFAVRVLLGLAAVCSELCRGRVRHALAALFGCVAGFCSQPFSWQERQGAAFSSTPALQLEAEGIGASCVYPGSVVREFFLRGRRAFNTLRRGADASFEAAVALEQTLETAACHADAVSAGCFAEASTGVCPLCSQRLPVPHRFFSPAVPGKGERHRTTKLVAVYLCFACDFAFLGTDDSDSQDSPPSFPDGSSVDIEASGPLAFLRSLARRVNWISKRRWLGVPKRDRMASTAGTRLLDVGCGEGWFLVQAQAKGWLTVGVEPDGPSAARAEARGLEVFRGELAGFATEARRGCFDRITLWHSLEHMRQPRDAIRQLAQLLAPDGLLILAVPNHRSIDARAFRSAWVAWDVPRHRSHFSYQSMMRLCSKELRLESIGSLWLDSWYNALYSAKRADSISARRGRSLLGATWVGARASLRSLLKPKEASTLVTAWSVRE